METSGGAEEGGWEGVWGVGGRAVPAACVRGALSKSSLPQSRVLWFCTRGLTDYRERVKHAGPEGRPAGMLRWVRHLEGQSGPRRGLGPPQNPELGVTELAEQRPGDAISEPSPRPGRPFPSPGNHCQSLWMLQQSFPCLYLQDLRYPYKNKQTNKT